MTGQAVNHEARTEDVRFLVETGESLTGAARRLGLSADGLEKWLVLRDMRAELAVLRSREPITSPDIDRRAISRANAVRRYGRTA